jgi:transposase
VSWRVETIPGIGVLGATAIVATAANGVSVGTRFRSLDRAGAAPGFDRGQAEARGEQGERSAARLSTRC